MFGLTMYEGAAVLGEAPVFTDGSWLANVPAVHPDAPPADRQVRHGHPQPAPLDPGHARRGSPLRRLPRVAHRAGRAGASARTRPSPSSSGAASLRRADSPSIADGEFPWDKKVQPILDAKCVGCHNALDDRRYYYDDADRPGHRACDDLQDPDARPLEHAGHRLLRPQGRLVAGLVRLDLLPGDAGMMGDSDTTGRSRLATRRPAPGTPRLHALWGIPGSARASALTQKSTCTAPTARRHRLADSREPAAPRGQGRARSPTTSARPSRVYPMDLGGQYWARQNTGFVPFTSGDPVTPVSRTEGSKRRHAMRRNSILKLAIGLLPLGGRVLRGDATPAARRLATPGDAQRAPASPASTAASRRLRSSSSRRPTPSRAPRRAAPRRSIWETLEHGEKVECLDCISRRRAAPLRREREEPRDRGLVAPPPHLRRLRPGRGLLADGADAPDRPGSRTRAPTRRTRSASSSRRPASPPAPRRSSTRRRRRRPRRGRERARPPERRRRRRARPGARPTRTPASGSPRSRRPGAINSFSSAGAVAALTTDASADVRRRAIEVLDALDAKDAVAAVAAAGAERRRRRRPRGRPATRSARFGDSSRDERRCTNLSQNDPDAFVRDQAHDRAACGC